MTTVMNRTQPTAAHDGADDECNNNVISRIQVLSKKGEHSKRFDSQAAQLTQELYVVHFGPPMVTKAVIRALNVRHVLWVEDAEGTPIAATMLMRHPHLKYYRVSGLAVDARHQQQGLGRALMHRLMTDPDQGERGGAAGGSGHGQAVH
jgi:GNAT superfamily N-acetyltransferase